MALSLNDVKNEAKRNIRYCNKVLEVLYKDRDNTDDEFTLGYVLMNIGFYEALRDKWRGVRDAIN